ncbi:MAG: carbohydrate binding family 9 domain-containing protein [Gemmatimonadota bacterium]|nr:carbohydrate binding family 9 domain-containing protein [Gemmatimonadota bacterium]
MSSFVLPLLLLQSITADSARVIEGRGAPAFEIPRIEAEVSIDGVLDEPQWARAARLVGFHGYQPVDGRQAEETTEVLVWYSPTAIHFGVVASDRDPASVRATLADRDNIGDEDRITIYLDTFDDRRRAFFFSVNPLGVQQDGVRSEGTSSPGRTFGGEDDLSPDYHFESRGRITERGYEVEIRIPFKSLRYPVAERQRWGINVTRHVKRTGHEDSWTDARRGSASFLGQSAAIEGLYGLERGVVVEAQPFVTAAANGARDPVSGRFERNDVEPEGGANLRLGFSNVSVDATINPDFSQVESDAGLVTANERFALFIPEKRPFFLEGIELFATPNQLVYTRQVENPAVGGKLTGKFGRWGIAHLTALDETVGRDALFNITRLSRDVGQNSRAGVTVTDRRQDGDYNTVVATDARIVFREVYYAEAQLGGSGTRDAAGTRHGGLFKLELDRTGRTFGLNYEIAGIEQEFETRAGFVPRTGIVTAHAFNRLRWYGSPGARMESLTMFAGPARLWRHDDFGARGALEGEESVSLDAQLRGGWRVEGRIARSFVTLDPVLYLGYEVEPAPGIVAPFESPDEIGGLASAALEVSTPVYRAFNVSARAALLHVPIFAEAAEGRERRVTASLNVRPTGSLRAELAVVASRITRERDGSEFARTIIPRLRAEYQPTRALFFRLVSEYRAERRAALQDARGRPILVAGDRAITIDANGMRVEWLAAFEPTPGTAAFLGYALAMHDRDPFALSHLRAIGDGLFVKLAYQFRR